MRLAEFVQNTFRLDIEQSGCVYAFVANLSVQPAAQVLQPVWHENGAFSSHIMNDFEER